MGAHEQRVEDVQAGARLPAAQDWITRHGYQRERRGGRYIGVVPSDYHFGELARRARLSASQLESREIRSQLARLARLGADGEPPIGFRRECVEMA